MNDRLADMGVSPGNGGGSQDNRRVSVFAQSQSPQMKLFFKEVEEVKRNISSISDATHRISELGSEQEFATEQKEEKRCAGEIEKKLTEVNRLAAETKTTLEGLKKKHGEKTAQQTQKDPEDRICENLLATLTRKFVDVIKDYQNIQLKYKTGIQKKSKRLIKAAQPEIEDGEIDKYLHDGGDIREVILMNKSEEIRSAFNNASEKYQGVLKIEKNMKELHEMFVELAMYVEDQSELLELIETQVMSAQDHIDVAIEETAKASKYALSARKKQACCCMLVLIVLVVIIVILVLQSNGDK